MFKDITYVQSTQKKKPGFIKRTFSKIFGSNQNDELEICNIFYMGDATIYEKLTGYIDGSKNFFVKLRKTNSGQYRLTFTVRKEHKRFVRTVNLTNDFDLGLLERDGQLEYSYRIRTEKFIKEHKRDGETVNWNPICLFYNKGTKRLFLKVS